MNCGVEKKKINIDVGQKRLLFIVIALVLICAGVIIALLYGKAQSSIVGVWQAVEPSFFMPRNGDEFYGTFIKPRSSEDYVEYYELIIFTSNKKYAGRYLGPFEPDSTIWADKSLDPLDPKKLLNEIENSLSGDYLDYTSVGNTTRVHYPHDNGVDEEYVVKGNVLEKIITQRNDGRSQVYIYKRIY